ncbi:calcium-binding protein, partial [Methylobacterium tarhaniae]|uniref:calcium-binding protein n=1 Tax=Methylobacterium tarhaniae TaxID=1187852 RepID=UPI00069D9545
MTTDSLTLATQAGAHATLAPVVLRLFGQATPAAEAVEAAIPTARAYHYGPETASLFETVSEVVYPSDGGTALKSQVREGWRTYNFEVEDLHTYIAGGLRVHNTSLPDLVPEGATDVVFADTDGDGKWDKADYKLGGGVSETIHGRDTDGNGTTDLVKRIKTIPREELLGPQDKVVWEEIYQGTSTVPSEKKIIGIEYAPGTLQGEEAGRTLGSVLGHAIGGSNIFAQVGSATITSTLLQNVGELLHKGVDLSLLSLDGHDVSPLEAAVTDTFKDFGKDLVGNAKVQALSALSGVLVGEIADALNLQGFERGLFSTVGNTVTNQVLTNVAMMTGVMEVPSTVVRENLNLLSGFDAVNMATNVANSLGGFFGSQLGQKAVRPHNEQASLFGSAASAVGAYIGTLTGLPIIGPMIGSFIGQTLGTMAGNAFADDDRQVHMAMQTTADGLLQPSQPIIRDNADQKFITLASTLAGSIQQHVNDTYTGSNLRIDLNHKYTDFSLGMYIDKDSNRKIYSVNGDFVASQESMTGLIAGSVDYVFTNSNAVGGDLFARRAYAASHKEGLTRLSFDLQVAQDFKKYLANTSLINSVIADSPESSFSAGWIATLQRALELGLNKLVDFNAMEYLASHGDLQQSFGRDKAAAERHMIEYGIPEGRRVTFDALEYLAANPGLAQAFGGIDRDRAVNHYLDQGRNEGRPTRFDATQYVAANGDLADQLGANNPEQALRHYIEYGYREGRTTTFDYRQYLAANPGLKEELGGVDPTTASRHYIETGRREGWPTQFNSYAYLASYPDLWQAFGRNFGALHQHVLDYGLRPTTFDASAYLNAHSDLQAAFGTNLEAAAEHFVVNGRNENWRTVVWYGGPDERNVVGGAGIDTVSYAYTSIGLVVDLNAQRTWNGYAGDNLFSIENAVGSYFNDTIHGSAGINGINGGAGNDEIFAHQGNDYVEGGVGHDVIVGGSGNDTLYGGDGDDQIHGEDDDDVIGADAGNDTVYGGSGNDRIFTHQGNDYVEGGVGHDIVVGGSGNDTLYGGDGDDQIHGEDDDDVIGAGAGNDTVYGGSGNDVIHTHQGNDSVEGGGGTDDIDGGDFEDLLSGGDGDDRLTGGNGFDTLRGDGGNDSLYGGNEDDVLDGGSGSNVIDGGSGTDTVSYETSGAAIVIDLQAQATFDGTRGDRLVSIENAIGSSFNDTLITGNGTTLLDGGSGNDTLCVVNSNQASIRG